VFQWSLARGKGERLKVKTYYGKVGSRLPDKDDYVRFAFEHTSGAILELRFKPGIHLPLDNQWIAAAGELTGTVLSATGIRRITRRPSRRP